MSHDPYPRDGKDVHCPWQMIAKCPLYIASHEGNERLFTYIDTYSVQPKIVRGNPVWGCCFRKAGWRFCGVSKARKAIIMEAFQ